ncbi:hypothetical protein NT04LM_4718, partial [Listeria monocytogenes FSL F2-208]
MTRYFVFNSSTNKTKYTGFTSFPMPCTFLKFPVLAL